MKGVYLSTLYFDRTLYSGKRFPSWSSVIEPVSRAWMKASRMRRLEWRKGWCRGRPCFGGLGHCGSD